MKILDLLSNEAKQQRGAIISISAISGLANAGMVAVINLALQHQGHGWRQFQLLLMFGLTIALYILTLKYVFDRAKSIFETMIDERRIRIAVKVANSELRILEQLGESKIFTRVTQDMVTISEAAERIVASLQAATMVAFLALYIATLSLAAFVLTASMVFGGTLIYLRTKNKLSRYHSQIRSQEEAFLRSITHVIDGFKELQVNQRKREDILAANQTISNQLRDLKIVMARLYDRNYIFSESFFFVLIAAIIFVLPQFIPTYSDAIIELTATILFTIGPLGVVVSALPHINLANNAAEHILALERELEEHLSNKAADAPLSVWRRPPAIETLVLDRVVYSYSDPRGRPFTLGPISLEIAAGSITFIKGGNGSGKSTLLKLLTGLYTPDSGRVLVNGAEVDVRGQPAYRELFAIIFTDFHLFDRLYGIREFDEKKASRLMEELGLAEKTSIVDGAFETLNLSTGQRKRLALVVALLDNKQIYIFDEWTADQDVHYRAYFYETLLPQLRSDGKTILVVTHDDRFDDYADTVIRLDQGQRIQ